MKKNIFKRPFQCSLHSIMSSDLNNDKNCNPSKVITFDSAKPSIEQIVKENIQLLQKPEDLPEEKCYLRCLRLIV